MKGTDGRELRKKNRKERRKSRSEKQFPDGLKMACLVMCSLQYNTCVLSGDNDGGNDVVGGGWWWLVVGCRVA